MGASEEEFNPFGAMMEQVAGVIGNMKRAADDGIGQAESDLELAGAEVAALKAQFDAEKLTVEVAGAALAHAHARLKLTEKQLGAAERLVDIKTRRLNDAKTAAEHALDFPSDPQQMLRGFPGFEG